MTFPEFAYTVLLRPKPLRAAANAALRAIIPTQTRVDGASVVLNPRDPVVSGALTLGVYERPETRVFRKLCRPGMVFLDVGANVGYYTALAMGAIGPEGIIVSMEPDTESFTYLERTVEANSGPKVILVGKAAGARTERARLFISSDNRGDNRMYENELCNAECAVDMIRVDDLFAELHLPHVDLIKIDVQGYEAHAIAGMDRLLDVSERVVMIFEFWPSGLERAGSNPHALLSELRHKDLDIFEISAKGVLSSVTDTDDLVRRFPGRRYTNLVAARKGEISADLLHA